MCSLTGLQAIDSLGTMSPSAQHLVEAIRIGLTGQPADVRKFALHLLRGRSDAADQEPSDAAFREALTRVLLQADGAPALTRAAVSKSSSKSRNTSPASTLVEPTASNVDASKRFIPQPIDSISGLPLERVDSEAHQPAPILPPQLADELQSLVSERQQSQDLAYLGLEPTRSVLFTGPPGVGKTMAAQHVASVLQLPLLRLDLAAVVSSFLGRTGQNLRQALEY